MTLAKFEDGLAISFINPARVAFISEWVWPDGCGAKAGERYTRIYFSAAEDDYTFVDMPILHVAAILDHYS